MVRYSNGGLKTELKKPVYGPNVRYSNGGLKTGLKKPVYGPKCQVFEWSAKLYINKCMHVILVKSTYYK